MNSKDFEHLISELMAEGETEGAKMLINHLISSAKKLGALQKERTLRLIKAKIHLQMGLHDLVLEETTKLIQDDEHEAHFVKAESLFMLDRIEDAWNEIQCCFFFNQYNAEVMSLACSIAERYYSRAYAKKLIYEFIPRSSRAKPWLIAANLTDTGEDLTELMLIWKDWQRKNKDYKKDVYEYIALAALRGGNINLARLLWQKSLLKVVDREEKFDGLNVKTPSYSSKRAEEALIGLNNFFNANDIEMFLVSGTLLGCIRENSLLGHDKDIDVGIWDGCDRTQLLKLIRQSGLFTELSSRSNEILRLKHINGINIDVFYHFREADDYWHGGVKMKWHNTPFSLEKRTFLNETFLIPSNAELYLVENYGDDWKEPITDFDSAFDTPNGEVLDRDEMAIHCFKGLLNSCIANNIPRINFYLNKLVEFGEQAFSEQYREALFSSGILDRDSIYDTE